jgi:toxin CcdB
MAKFDVHCLGEHGHYVLDCQADLLSDLNTRLVVPLLPFDEAPKPASRLNPVFSIEGRRLVMVTQFAASVPVRELGPAIKSLASQREAVDAALDMLIIGF